MKKKIVGLICLILIISPLMGCSKKEKETLEDITFKYLNDTYVEEDDTFTFISCRYDLFPGSNERCHFKSEKYDGTVKVRILKNDDKSYALDDDYHKLYLYDAVKLYIEENDANLNYYEMRFRFGVDYNNKYLTFEEYKDNAKLDVFYFTENDIGESKREQILNKLAKKRCSFIKFYTTYDVELLKDIDYNTIVNNYSQYIKDVDEYQINCGDTDVITKTPKK